MIDNLYAFLCQRTSGVAIRLRKPGPDIKTVTKLLQCGMSAPDHGGLKPWRFCIMQEEKIKTFAEHIKRIKKEEDKEISDEDLEKIYQKPFRAPCIIACWSETQQHENITADEQFATTAMAVENFLIAAQNEGWGAVLLSGWFASNPKIQQLFGLKENDKMLGYIYMGTHVKEPRIRKRPQIQDFIVKAKF